MKHKTIPYIILFVILTVACPQLLAQDYLLTTKGDTLKGTVKPLYAGLEQKVQVTDNQKNKSIISIFKTREFLYRGDTYRPVRNDKGYVFMKLVKDGYLSLYGFQLEGQTSFDGQFLSKRDGHNLEIPNLGFKKAVGKYLGECPLVAQKIDDGTYTKKDLHQIVDDFNSCITSRSNPQRKPVVTESISPKKTEAWDNLEENVKLHADFEEKTNALEMIADIKGKIKRSEKIPRFLIEGLKSSLAETTLKTQLDECLATVN